MATKDKNEAPKPLETIKEGPVLASIWQKKDQNGGTYFTVSVGRLYKDDTDKWRTNGGLYSRDAENTGAALSKAFTRLEALEQAQARSMGAAQTVESKSVKPAVKPKAPKGYTNTVQNWIPTGYEDY